MMHTSNLDIGDEYAVAAARSDPAEFGQLFDAYFVRVVRYVHYRIGDRQIAEDLAAHTFERAFGRLQDFRPEKGSFAAWLFAIARNAANDHLRTTKRRPWFSLETLLHLPSPGGNPAAIIEGQEELRELLGALLKLKEREREVIALKFGGGLTNREIARLLHLTETNVAVIVFRSLRMLRQELKPGERP